MARGPWGPPVLVLLGTPLRCRQQADVGLLVGTAAQLMCHARLPPVAAGGAKRAPACVIKDRNQSLIAVGPWLAMLWQCAHAHIVLWALGRQQGHGTV
jgi:hypothetical protein